MANIQKVESSAANGKRYLVYVYVFNKAKKNLFMLFFFQGQNEWYQKKLKWISFIDIHHEILYVLKVINFLPVN